MSRSQIVGLSCITIFVMCIALVLIPDGVQGAARQDQVKAEDHIQQVEADQEPGKSESADSRTEVAHTDSPSDEEADPELDVEVVEAERFLLGTVLDKEFNPIADAWVIADVEAQPVRTAEDGTFQLPLLKPFSADEGRDILAWKEGLSVTSKHVRQQEGNLLVLKVDEGKEIQVLDQDSQLPLAGATVVMQVDVESESGNGFFDLRRSAIVPATLGPTDGDGKVKIPDPKVSNAYSIEITLEGYDRRTLNQWEVRRSEKVFLARPKQTRMRFTREDGTPHAGARLCFSWQREIVTMDDQGWVDLPTSARWGFWSVQLIDEDTMWVFNSVGAEQIADGATLLTHYEPRHGKLFVEGGEKASQYEIASSGSWSGWGNEYLPDPTWNHEDLIWLPINDRGEFKVESGWQSKESYLHVRRVGSKGVLLSQKVDGPGPHNLSLASASMITFKVECAQPELLEGATLKVEGYQTDHEVSKDLADGKVEMRLPVDKFQVSLTLPDLPHSYPLGKAEVVGMDMEQTFHFAGLRSASGQLRADGEGVFPCRVRIRSSEGFYTNLETNPEGKWELKGAPEQNLTIEFLPEDNWLTPLNQPRFDLPRGMSLFDYDLPVGYLLISPGDLLDEELEQLSISRRALPGEGNQRGYQRSSRPKNLDFENGEFEVVVGPSLITFSANNSGLPLANTEIEVRAGETKTFSLQSVATTLTSIKLKNCDFNLWGSWNVSPIDVPGMRDYPSFKVQEAQGQQVPGQIGNAKHLLPGKWRVWVRAPFWYWTEYDNGQVGNGRLDFEINVSGDWQDIWLKLGENQKIERVTN